MLNLLAGRAHICVSQAAMQARAAKSVVARQQAVRGQHDLMAEATVTVAGEDGQLGTP